MQQQRQTGDAGPAFAYDRWRHRYAVLLAAATVLLLAAGGLVTSTGSGLAVPDWPLSFGKIFPPMVGGVLFEHGHRLIAGTVGLMTLILSAWFARSERRSWVRRLSFAACGLVVLQGILGGVTVLLRLPPAVSVAHACLAQAFFCVTVILALATSRGFMGGDRVDGRSAAAVAPLAAAAAGLVYGQLILGAVMRHTGAGLAIPDFPLALGRLVPPLGSPEVAVHFAHRLGALIVALAVGVLALRVRRLGGPAQARGLAGPARLAVLLVLVQVTLGALTVLSRLSVVPATAHVVTGALLLATTVVLGARCVPVRRARTAIVSAGAAMATGGMA